MGRFVQTSRELLQTFPKVLQISRDFAAEVSKSTSEVSNLFKGLQSPQMCTHHLCNDFHTCKLSFKI